MKKTTTLIISLSLLLLSTPYTKADEGMWVLPLIEKLNIDEMQTMGLELSASDIYSEESASLKDAVVIFGGGCTGEVISQNGLLLTNHHCGYGQIQELSTLEDNFLDNGFWASSYSEELHAPSLTATFLKYMTDVTDKVLKDVKKGMTKQERIEAISKAKQEILNKESGKNSYSLRIADFYEGNQYYLIAYQEFRDVRLVGTPPNSIGKFGYDTDNWMWPRHTGDFALFRIYADKDNKPADYCKDNVPYRPDYHIPISLEGFQKGDFAMTLGYPGSTQRYLSSWGVKERVNIFNRTLIDVRGAKQDIWSKAMAENDTVRLQYATKFTSSSNYWKNSIGMNESIEANNVIAQKQQLEERFQEWALSDKKLKRRYGNILDSIKSAYEKREEHYLANNYLRETLIRGAEILFFGASAASLQNALEDDDSETIKKEVENFKESAKDFFENYHAPTDQKVLAKMLKMYGENIDEKFHPPFYQLIKEEFNNDYEKFAENLFKNSLFTSKKTLNQFLDNPDSDQLNSDPAYSSGVLTLQMYRNLLTMNSDSQNKLSRAQRVFMEGLMKKQEEKVFYPDANFSMRMSYGTIENYEPRDGVIYKHYTTLSGVIEKEDPDNFEFHLPDRLKKLYKKGDYGKYANEDREMVVNFITTNDITGGNSGSPVFNKKGHLIGIAFDGNWEAMSGDILFEDELQKCISVDMRYMLFIIDKYAGASHLIDEMTLIK
ncbi:S46 family peptidase [Marinilabiliaceae bacterium ANBcel2]|nr:S46 family peptidase [Marinilabiliaceae bacterium ANBcel2]